VNVISALGHLSSWVAIGLIAALVFGETALFFGFFFPGEAAVVLGGVLASRGHVALIPLIVAVVVAAVIGPLVGYEIGRRVGSRLLSGRLAVRAPRAMERVETVMLRRGGAAVLVGRFFALLRPLMPAAAGVARMPRRVFLLWNLVGAAVWGVGFCLLGYLAGSAYVAVERTVGAGLALALVVLVIAVVAVFALRHQRSLRSAPPGASASSPPRTVQAGDDPGTEELT
jgi:membrane-associated protein